MSELMQVILEQHRDVLERLEAGEADDLFLDDVLALVDDLRQAGDVIADPAQRAQLRALIRFWGGVMYDYTGIYPTVTLLPADTGEDPTLQSAAPRSAPPLLWLLAGGASVAIIATALVIIGWMSRYYEHPTLETPSVSVAPRVVYVVAENRLGANDSVTMGAAAFCRGASEAVFHFVLEDNRPDIALRWELQRSGAETSSHPAIAYGDDNQNLTIRIGSEGLDELASGPYELTLYADDDAVWVQSFEVLDIDPRAFSFQVSDVPEPTREDALQDPFEPGVRAIYLRYGYEGLCSGLELSHTLYRNGEPIQKIDQVWQGTPRGEAQVIFQAPAGTVFAGGEYEVSVAIAGEEQGRITFQILE